jgi:hypothetical protein
MRKIALAAVGLAGACAWGQTHAVRKPDSVVRAVAVYEWTGEEGKPTASRVVPVSLFIDGQFQDAAIYMARPVPLALDTGTVYEVRKAGIDAGDLELVYERHLTSGDTAEIDDGWLGYGALKLKPKPTYETKKQSGALPQIAVNGNAPHFGGKPAAGASPGSTPAAADDPDRPSFHKRSDANDSSAGKTGSTGSAGSSSDAADEADRPTLKRRSPAEIKANQKKKDSARVVAGNDLNDDPDRPTLHRGSTTHTDEEEIPPLRGLPKDMRQSVAVSDAKDRPEHDFARSWESADEKAEVLGKMQEFARAQLAEYKGVGPAEAPAPAPVPAPSSKAKRRHPVAPATPLPVPLPLNDELIAGYTLSYGGAATYVYMATSPGANGVARYVTLVAQDDPVGGLKVALASVTDSTHLDRTPWMRLVDVVDADASNRASLVMELRAAHTRQFALYRVIGAKADQLFLTGSTE